MTSWRLSGPSGTSSQDKDLGDGRLVQPFVAGHTLDDLMKVPGPAWDRARLGRENAYFDANALFGFAPEQTGTLHNGWLLKVDGGKPNFRFDAQGNRTWIDSMAVLPTGY